MNAARKASRTKRESGLVSRLRSNWIRGGGIGVLVVLIACFAVWKIHEAGPGTAAQGNRSTSAQGSLPSSPSATTSPATSPAGSSPNRPGEAPVGPEREGGAGNALVPSARLPKLLDLGAGKCIPCKMMAPILEDLRAQYTEDFEAIFVDVWVDREAAARYGVRVIPTQIFFDEGGNELRRHVGFFSREEILGTWEEPGYSFPAR